MKAGRELDALIFQYVLGYSDPVEVCCGAAYKKAPESAWFKVFKKPPEGAVFKSHLGYSFDRFTTRSGEGIYCANPFKPYIPDFYSTNISHAFEVVEKIGGFFQLTYAVHGLNGWEWQAHFSDPNPEGWRIFATAETVPLAICFAALLVAELETRPHD